MNFKFHHIGVITADLQKSAEFYTHLGYRPSQTFIDPLQKSEIVFMESEDQPTVELIKPTDKSSPAQGWLDKLRGGPYHLCFEVNDLEAAILELRQKGLALASKPQPAMAFNGRHVCFLWNLKSGLIELLQT